MMAGHLDLGRRRMLLKETSGTEREVFEVERGYLNDGVS